MFGYVTLGGQKLEAFIWEIEGEPEMFDCVILYSQAALEQKLVSLRLRVPAERTFLDEKVQKNLNAESTTIANKCQTKLDNNEEVGRRVSFEGIEPMTPDFETEDSTSYEFDLSEAQMLQEVEEMLQCEESPGYGGQPALFLEDDDFMEGACLYEAETFGGKMVDDEKEEEEEFGGDYIRSASTIKRPLIEQFLDSPNLSLRESLRGLRRDLSQRLAPAAVPCVEGDSAGWSMDLEDKVVEEVCLKLQQKKSSAAPRNLRAFSTTTDLHNVDLPPMDDEPELGNRQAAFVSTRGKEREIWQTYRDEITQTWKAELEELRRDLFTECAPLGA